MATWDAAFEASPADSDEVKYGANKIRALKAAISERGELEHNFKANTQPYHKAGLCSVAYASITANITALASPPVGSIAWDTTLKSLKIRSANAWDRCDPIPIGTKMLFYADTAPAGWTIDNTLDDKLVFVTKGNAAGGQTGGAAHANGTWTISGLIANAHTHTTPVLDHGWSGSGSGVLPAASPLTDHPATATAVANANAVTADGVWRPAAYSFIICAKA